jgi:DNA polymerase-3 subunit delta
MFGGNTVVTVRDSGIFKSAGSGADNDFGFLKDLPEDSFVFFRETEVDKRNKNYKILEECGVIFECKYQKPEMIIKILERQASSLGRHISVDAVSLMVTGIGQDLVRIISEVNKLSHLVEEGETIQASHVRQVCELSLSAKIFDLTDGIAENNKEKAFTMLQVLLADKMPPAQIMNSIGRHFMQLYNVRCLLDKGASKSEIISSLSVHEFVATKLMRQAKVYTEASASKKVKLIAEMDVAIKSGTMDPVNALEIIIGTD